MDTPKRLNVFVTVSKLMFREALLLKLLSLPSMNLVGESSCGADTLGKLDQCRLDLLIIEEELIDNDGLTVSEIALNKQPSLIVILLVESVISESRLKIYLESGIASVVPKTQPVQNLIKAISYVQNGRIYVDPDTCHAEHRRDAASLAQELTWAGLAPYLSLSERERDVADMLAQQITIKDIAGKFGLSIKTIHTYKDRILIKTGCTGAPELMLYMQRVRMVCQPRNESIDEAV